MRLFRQIKIGLSSLLLATGFCGCNVLHDDLSGCSFYLKFRYDYNMESRDQFGEQVPEVKVFVFSAEGGYLRTFSESGPSLQNPGYRMEIPYEMKGCSMMVWAGTTEDDYLLPTLQTGDPAEKLTLCYEPDGSASAHRIAPLWFCGQTAMIFPEEGGTTQTVSLIRDTNDIGVGVSTRGTTVDPADFDIRLTGANGGYDCQNLPLPGNADIVYTPAEYAASAAGKRAQLYTLRLLEANALTLTVTEKSTGKSVLVNGSAEIDLPGFLLKGKPSGLGDQEYLDRRWEWDIVLNYEQSSDSNSYLAVSLTINGWTFWLQNTDI